jgi:hypothetical protein
MTIITRPQSKEYEDNFDRIFGKKDKEHFNQLLHDSEEDKFPDEETPK